ncbi:hsp90 co-chaperone Cdc37-like, partial [Pempheris klunzingeri]|uniref:hsp90 co-chaperone Cdc37-like n=1 Tax=Pempheris klunzingeri TaxID=3127111 RepID=UPI00397EBCC6
MVDYSKWSKIEVSDDEDDTHPNIDTGSLFRWRHKARIERMEEFNKRKEDVLEEKSDIKEKLNCATLNYEKAEKDNIGSEKIDEIKAELDKLKQQYDEIIKREADLLHEEKKQAWNVDTICHTGFDSSIVSSYGDKSNEDNFNYDGLADFVETHQKEIETYGMLSDHADSRSYLLDHIHLVCDQTSAYLCLWCIDLAVEEKWALFEIVTKQAMSLQFILELVKNINAPKAKLVNDMFSKLNKNLPEYKKYYDDELEVFRQRTKDRAKERIKEEIERIENEEREKRLGPGGLDPHEVFGQLPEELQKCFEERNIDLLKETLEKMNVEDAHRYMNMCVDSGLWLPE